MQFADLGLDKPLLDAVIESGYTTPSPIQAKAIPAVLSGKDVMAAAQTGTGKTAGFTLPLLQLLGRGERPKANQARALVLTPTRELAAQVSQSIESYGKNLPLTSTVVYGGVKINPQMQRLTRGVDILVATPGRLLDLYQQNAVKFQQLEVLVLDEADRMLDMGFIHDIKRIIKLLPKQRQNLLFSATFSDEIRHLAKGLVNQPLEISVTPPNSTVEAVEQLIHPVDKKQKTRLLLDLIVDNNWQQVLVFSRTKHGANRLSRDLEKFGVSSAAIHGNKSQGARTKALADFKKNSVRVLVATDIAARGLDIDKLPHVVNFDLPNVPEDYVHRIGRTGRAGSSGQAISLVSADEFKQLSDIERLIQREIPRIIIDGYEPVHDVPESRAVSAPKRKKPKKYRAEDSFRGGSSQGGNSRGNNTGPRSQNNSGDRSKPNTHKRRESPGASASGTRPNTKSTANAKPSGNASSSTSNHSSSSSPSRSSGAWARASSKTNGANQTRRPSSSR